MLSVVVWQACYDASCALSSVILGFVKLAVLGHRDYAELYALASLLCCVKLAVLCGGCDKLIVLGQACAAVSCMAVTRFLG